MIFESPDKGETVYGREPGTSERVLVSESARSTARYDQLMEDKMWGEIRRLAKTNPTLKDAVDKVIMVYHIVKDR